MTIKKTAKVAKAAKANGNGKASTAEFIRAEIKKGTEDKKILALARKRAPKQKIRDYFVSWYRWQMKQKPAARKSKAARSAA